MKRTKSGGREAMAMVNPGAAAIDIASTMHMAAINEHAVLQAKMFILAVQACLEGRRRDK